MAAQDSPQEDAEPKAAVVTGAASGIGAEIARTLAAAGWWVALVDLNEKGLDEVAASLPSVGDRAHLVHAIDVSQGSAVENMVRTTASTFGRLDGVVNAAGVSLPGDLTIEALPDDVFDRTLAINLRGTFLVCKHAMGFLSERGGAIANFASTAIFAGNGSPAYAASKGGVAALSRVIAYQGSSRMIRCNCICPGSIDTPMLDQVCEKLGLEDLAHVPGTIPRLGQPQDVASLVRFLLSDEATYITGATYTVDGGSTLH